MCYTTNHQYSISNRWLVFFCRKGMNFMKFKIKGLNIVYNQGHLMFLMTEDAMKEFCDYHGIPYTDGELHTNGIVTTRKWKIQSKMIHEYSKLVLNNNWRRRHRIPMIRKVCKKRWIKMHNR